MAKEIERAEDTTQDEKNRGVTPSQKEVRSYHEGAFQTQDPVTGHSRTLPADPVAEASKAKTGERKTGERKTVESKTAKTESADYDGLTVEELRAEAGDLEVRRSDGEGVPLKSDYIKALKKRDRSR